jgi:exoribonuclease R
MEHGIIFMDDNQYRSFYVTKDKNPQEIPPLLDPLDQKLFDQDEIRYSLSGDTVELVHSPVRQHKSIPGILLLASKKTFGRSGKKMMYQCYPDDKHLPIFLVPYQEKAKFSKNPVNLFVTFEFQEWVGKHPIGSLTNTLGSVDELPSFYEYQLYCKSLNASIQHFTRDAAKALKQKTEDEFIEMILEKYPQIQNKISNNVPIFAIDPKHSRDYDDAFSIEPISPSEYILCIYISNVTLWMEVLNLWGSFSNRVSTIYLPDKRRPMLPTCLSECLCSLVAGERRFAFTCEMRVKDDTIIDKKYYNSAVRLLKNFGYDDPDLDGFLPYQQLFAACISLKKKYKGINFIRGSHDIVNYLMVLMNNFSGNEMIQHENGIYRSLVANEPAQTPPSTLSDEGLNFLQYWNSNGGQYVPYSTNINHDLMNLHHYIHITSPIRRLVDLLNMLQLQMNMKLMDFSQEAKDFMKNWFAKLDYINKTTRAVRRVQGDCELLDTFTKNQGLYEKTHTGVVFDKIKRNDGYFQYGVYLYDVKLATRLKMLNDLDNYTEHTFNVYLFQYEETLKKKIKLLFME